MNGKHQANPKPPSDQAVAVDRVGEVRVQRSKRRAARRESAQAFPESRNAQLLRELEDESPVNFSEED